MAKPPGTYLRTQAPTKIANQAAQALALKQKVESELRTGFTAVLHSKRLDRAKIDGGLKLAPLLRKIAKGEPITGAAELVKKVSDWADDVNDAAEKMLKVKELLGVKEVKTAITTIKQLHKAAGQLEGKFNPVNAMNVAVLIVVVGTTLALASKRLGAKL